MRSIADANYGTMQAHIVTSALLPEHKSFLDKNSTERYDEKLALIGESHQYGKAWKNGVELWRSRNIYMGMHLVFSPSSYTDLDFINYKSLECYQIFLMNKRQSHPSEFC